MIKAIMAATGPPPMTIQSPTIRTQPVPMMAPKPMVKKFQSDKVFCIPPLLVEVDISKTSLCCDSKAKYSNDLEQDFALA